jgi:hypothetical protein
MQNSKSFLFKKTRLNNIIFTEGRSLDAECPDWREQIFEILNDIVHETC